jgi:hypothetical protein
MFHRERGAIKHWHSVIDDPESTPTHKGFATQALVRLNAEVTTRPQESASRYKPSFDAAVEAGLSAHNRHGFVSSI